MLCFHRFPKWSSKAGENNCSLLSEETEIHRENMTFPRALQAGSGRAVNTTCSLVAGATDLSHLIPDRQCPETGT